VETLWWSLSILLVVAGLLGTVLPVLPDSLLILAGGVLHHFTIPPERAVSWWTLAILAILTVLAHLVDFVAASVGAKRFGASRWGALGAFVGAVVGLFFFPLGLFVGPVVGVLCAEILFARKSLGPAARSSWGTLLGTLVGMAGKIVIAVLMAVIFFAAAFSGRF
jgi:uncharacterized protein YqgC (DUF456 family)